MKAFALISSAILFFVFSCEQQVEYIDDGPFLMVEDSVIISYTDIDYYDFSEHTIFLNDTNTFHQRMAANNFDIYADGERIYSGEFYPCYYSRFPYGAYISTICNFTNDPEWFQIEFAALDRGEADPRGDERIKNSLKANGQYRK